MTLSYLALALAIVLFLAGIAGTTFTLRTIAHRRPEFLHGIKTQIWPDIDEPLHAFRFDYLAKEPMRRYARFSRLLYRVAHYVALSVAAVEKMAVSLIQLLRQ